MTMRSLGACFLLVVASWSFFSSSLLVANNVVVEAAVHPDGACPLLTVLPFSIYPQHRKKADVSTLFTDDYLSRYGFDLLASIEMAMEHFNDRNPVVVPQLHERQMGTRTGDDDDGNGCNVYFPPQKIVDSGFTGKLAISGTLRATYEQQQQGQQQQQQQTRPKPDGTSGKNDINSTSTTATTNSTSTRPAESAVEAGLQERGQGQQQQRDDDDNNDDDGKLLLPCGVIGPTVRGIFHEMVPTTRALEIPHVSPFQAKNLLWGDSAIGLTATTAHYVGAVLDFVRHREYLCVIYTGGTDETELANIIRTMAPEYGVRFELIREGSLNAIPIVLTPSMREKHTPWAQAAGAAELTGIRTIFIVTKKTRNVRRYAEAFAERNMLTDDYVYVLHPEAVATDRALSYFAETDPEDPVRRLLSGALIFDPALDGFRSSPETDRFLKAWKGLDGDFARRVRDKIPKDSPAIPDANLEDYFQTHTPVNYASYAYDAVIALGLGACREMKEAKTKLKRQPKQQSRNETWPDSQGQQSTDADEKSSPNQEASGDDQGPPGGKPAREDGKPAREDGKPAREDGKSPPADEQSSDDGKPPPRNDGAPPADNGNKPPSDNKHSPHGRHPKREPVVIDPEKLTPHVRGIFETAFEGASGVVRFTETGMLSRESTDVRMGLYNVQYPPNGDYLATDGLYVPTLVSVWSDTAAKWQDWKGPSSNNVLRRRSGAPGLIAATRVIFEENFLPPGVRAVGLTLMGSVWALMTACLSLLFYLRTNQAVKQSQPFFLGLVCLGSYIMSTSIFTLSWDEGAGWTTKQLHVACTLTPWFFFVGNIMVFASLSTKMWRIDKVLQFRRHQVNVRSSLGPLLVVLFLTLIILTTWTAEDPWIWERIPISTLPSETYGTCTSERFWAYFGSLMGVLIISEAVTIYFTWKTKDIPEGLSDRMPVILALVAQMQAWVIGVPVLALLDPSSTSAVYFGRVGLIWLFSVSAPVSVVCPKLYAAVRSILFPQTIQRRQSRVSISGINRSCDMTGPTAATSAAFGGFDASSAFLRHPRPGVDGGASSAAFGGGTRSKSFRRSGNAGSFYHNNKSAPLQCTPPSPPSLKHIASSALQRRPSPPSPMHNTFQRRLSPPREESGSVFIEFGSVSDPSASTASTTDKDTCSSGRTKKSKSTITIFHPKDSKVESVVEESSEAVEDDRPPEEAPQEEAPPQRSDTDPARAADGVKGDDKDNGV